MRIRKPVTATTPAVPNNIPTPTRYRFDALDWMAAFFVIATPIYIVYQFIK
jgi:hypothetical protein